jgi:flagellar basal-body rod modification protein FlgD
MTTVNTNSNVSTNSTSNTSSSSSSATSSSSGFNNLTADDFMTMLITELQNQDPTQPMNSEDLLNQLATMRSLQSNIELGNAMQAITTNQQLSTAANFIGKYVSGTDDQTNPVSGVVDSASLQNGTAYVGVGNSQISLSNLTNVAAT